MVTVITRHTVAATNGDPVPNGALDRTGQVRPVAKAESKTTLTESTRRMALHYPLYDGALVSRSHGTEIGACRRCLLRLLSESESATTKRTVAGLRATTTRPLWSCARSFAMMRARKMSEAGTLRTAWLPCTADAQNLSGRSTGDISL